MAVEVFERAARALQAFKFTPLDCFADAVFGNDWNRSDHLFITKARIASTKPGIVWIFASAAISKPFSRAAWLVCGPMLTNRICGNCARSAGTSTRLQKFVTV